METIVEHVWFTETPSPVDSPFKAFLYASTAEKCIDKWYKIVNWIILKDIIRIIKRIKKLISTCWFSFTQHCCDRIIERWNKSISRHNIEMKKNLDQLQYWRRRKCFLINTWIYVYVINNLWSEILTVYYSSDFSDGQGNDLS